MKNFNTFVNENTNKSINKSINKTITNKNVNIGDTYHEHDIYSYSQKMHHTYDDFIDGDLGERIEQYSEYVVKSISIYEIEIDEFMIDEGLVDEYKEEFQRLNTYPPIILNSDYSIIDGTHRVNALNDLGIENVVAFVGVL